MSSFFLLLCWETDSLMHPFDSFRVFEKNILSLFAGLFHFADSKKQIMYFLLLFMITFSIQQNSDAELRFRSTLTQHSFYSTFLTKWCLSNVVNSFERKQIIFATNILMIISKYGHKSTTDNIAFCKKITFVMPLREECEVPSIYKQRMFGMLVKVWTRRNVKDDTVVFLMTMMMTIIIMSIINEGFTAWLKIKKDSRIQVTRPIIACSCRDFFERGWCWTIPWLAIPWVKGWKVKRNILDGDHHEQKSVQDRGRKTLLL